MDALCSKIRDIIAVELQVDRDKVVPAALLRGDLGMDSIAALNILFAAEETFGLPSIDVAELVNVKTVEEVETFLRHRIVAPAS
jgi:acyl carrier protein